MNARLSRAGSSTVAESNPHSRLTAENRITDEHLTASLATRVMRWRVGPERFMTGDRGWLPRSQFQPLKRTADAFKLLENSCAVFTLTKSANGKFAARVQIGEAVGIAAGEPKARTISLAIAAALGICPDEQCATDVPLAW